MSYINLVALPASQPKRLARSSGLTLPELLIYVAILATTSIFLATQFANLTAGTQIERGFSEIEKIRAAAIVYRSSPRHTNYTGISISSLATGGYNIRPFSDGANENAFGRSVIIAPTQNNADANLTYETDNDTACQQLIERYTDVQGIASTPTCAGDTLTLVLE